VPLPCFRSCTSRSANVSAWPAAGVGALLARQLADEEGQGAQPGPELVVFLSAKGLDAVVDVVRKHIALRQIRTQLVVDEVARHDGAERGLRRFFDGLVHQFELGAELALRARLVDGAENPLPKPPPRGQNRIIVDDMVLVLRLLLELGAGQVP
jgi:hypothetical protein